MGKYGSILVIVITLILGCKSNNANKKTVSKTTQNLIFLDSLEASRAIIERDIDGFFDQLSIADISIQMKKNTGFKNLTEARNAYKSFLKKEVATFSEDEKIYMQSVFDEVNSRLKRLNPNLILPEISLVKIKTNHYGEDVYYTRGRMICLPANTLQGRGIEGQTNVMLHEIWHIISRYNEDIRKEAYALIGFQPIEVKPQLPPFISERLLTNPDGVRMDYMMDLGDGIKGIPILTSKYKDYQNGITKFFDYLVFDLYEIDKSGKILVNSNGTTTIPIKNNAEFFKKIKDNTQYIIHPDEIIADNFMLAVNAYNTGETSKFSKEGVDLIENFTNLLKEFD